MKLVKQNMSFLIIKIMHEIVRSYKGITIHLL